MNDFPLQEAVSYAVATYEIPQIRRDLAKGVSSYHEQYAYKHILPTIQERRDETRALRVVGLLAGARVKHNPDQSFGRWCSKLSAKQTEVRLMQVQNLSFEQAISELGRILAMADRRKDNDGFNWYDLAKTLYYWGNGVSDASVSVRQGILREYYRGFVASDEKDKENNKESKITGGENE